MTTSTKNQKGKPEGSCRVKLDYCYNCKQIGKGFSLGTGPSSDLPANFAFRDHRLF